MADYFLKIDGIKGESTDRQYKEWIEIQSFSWGVTNTGSAGGGGGGGVGRAVFQDVSFAARTTTASPILMLRCASGQHIKTARLVGRRGGGGGKGDEFYKVDLEDLLVSSYQVGGSSGEPVPTDQFSLNFARIRYGVRTQDAKGGAGGEVAVEWDVRGNEGDLSVVAE